MSIKKSARLKHPPYQKFKAFLVENKIRQKEVAELLGLTPVTINQKINGYLNFTWPEIERICDKYKIEYALFKTVA